MGSAAYDTRAAGFQPAPGLGCRNRPGTEQLSVWRTYSMVAEQLNLIRSLERLNLALNFCPRHPPVEPGANKSLFDFPAGTQIATLGFLVCHQKKWLSQVITIVIDPSLSAGPR